jgi:hypothetical protein
MTSFSSPIVDLAFSVNYAKEREKERQDKKNQKIGLYRNSMERIGN